MPGLGIRVKTSREPNKVCGYNMTQDTRFLRTIGTGDTDFDNLTGYTFLIFLEDTGGRYQTLSNTHFPAALSIGTTNVGMGAEFTWYTGTDSIVMRKYDGSGATTNNQNVNLGGTYANTWANQNPGNDVWTGASSNTFAVAQTFGDTTDEGDEYQDFYFSSKSVLRKTTDIDVDNTGDISVSGSEIRICDGVNSMWDLDYISKGLKVNKIMFWKQKITNNELYRLCGYGAPSSYSESGVNAVMGVDCFRDRSRFFGNSNLKFGNISVTQPHHQWDFTSVKRVDSDANNRAPKGYIKDGTGVIEDTGSEGDKPLTCTGPAAIISFLDPANKQAVGTR